MHLIRKIALVAAIVAMAGAPASAQAANGFYDSSASGGTNYYDGKNPATTGCNKSASLIATRPIKSLATGKTVTNIEIYYSSTCRTNWIRVPSNPYLGPTVKFIRSDRGGWNSEVDDHGNTISYSMMVYAPGDTGIDGYVYLDGPVSGDYWPKKAVGSFSL